MTTKIPTLIVFNELSSLILKLFNEKDIPCAYGNKQIHVFSPYILNNHFKKDELNEILEKHCKSHHCISHQDLIDMVEPKEKLKQSEPVSFEDAVKPLMKYLCDNHHPHTKVIVTPTEAEVLEGVKCFETHEFLND